MTDLIALKARIKASGMTMTAISQQSGILRETLYNRLAGKSEFRASEIQKLTYILKLKKTERDSIFFS